MGEQKFAQMVQGDHLESATKFHDFSLTEFYFSLTKIQSFYGLFLFLQPINDKFSLCSSPILQFKKNKMFEKFWGKTFLIDHYKLLIVSNERNEREKKSTFSNT